MLNVFRALCLAALLATPVVAVDAAMAQGTCLSRHEQRQAIRSGSAIRPGQIRKTLGGQVLRLRLCRTASGLVWHVTVLRENGRVHVYILDARSGRRIR